MEFDSTTLVLSTIFIVVIAFPFVLISRSIRKNKRQMMRQLQAGGNKYSLDVTDSEVWNTSAIALDAPKKKLLFIKKSTYKEDQELFVDLHKVTNCKVEKSSVGKAETDTYKIIKVDIILKSDQNKLISIPVFDVLFDDPVEGDYHLMLAKKWQAKIHEIIKSGHTRRAA